MTTKTSSCARRRCPCFPDPHSFNHVQQRLPVHRVAFLFLVLRGAGVLDIMVRLDPFREYYACLMYNLDSKRMLYFRPERFAVQHPRGSSFGVDFLQETEWKCGSLSLIFTHPPEDLKKKRKKELIGVERSGEEDASSLCVCTSQYPR